MLNKALLKRIVWPATAIMLAWLLYLWLNWSKPEVERVDKAKPAPSISVQYVEISSLAPELLLIGRVETPSLTTLTAPQELDVLSKAVLSGDAVDQGAVLVQLDDRELLLQKQQLKADLAVAQAELERSRVTHAFNQKSLKNDQEIVRLSEKSVARTGKLAKNQTGTLAALDTAREALAQAKNSYQNRLREIEAFAQTETSLQASVERIEASIALLQLDIEAATAKAPFDGYVTEVTVSAGQTVNKGQALVSLYPRRDLELRAQLPSEYALTVRQMLDQEKSVYGEIEVVGQQRQIAVTRLGAEINNNLASVDLFFSVADIDGLQPGLNFEVTLKLPALDNVFAVPVDALYGRDLLYLVENDQLKSVKVKRMGQLFSEDGVERVIVHSDSINNDAQVMVSRLPQAVTGLAVSIVN